MLIFFLPSDRPNESVTVTVRMDGWRMLPGNVRKKEVSKDRRGPPSHTGQLRNEEGRLNSPNIPVP